MLRDTIGASWWRRCARSKSASRTTATPSRPTSSSRSARRRRPPGSGAWRSPARSMAAAGWACSGQVIVAEEAAKCRMGAYVPACGAFGIDPPSVIWLGHRGADARSTACRHPAAARRTSSRSPRPPAAPTPATDPHPRGRRGRPLRAQRHEDVDHRASTRRDWGIVFARTGEAGNARRHHLPSSSIGDSPGISCREIG